jgi:HK97 gp10 family phage protein
VASTVTVRVEGLQALGEAMRELSRDVALRVSRQATGAAAQVIKRRAKSNIRSSPSVDTGSLLDAVIVKKIPNSQTRLTSEHIVTVRGKSRRGGRKTKTKQAIAPHARFIEFGTTNAPAEPFLRPAFDAGKEEAMQKMVERLRVRIEAVRPK